MKTYYLAIDIGASSGRHILAYIKEGRMDYCSFMHELLDVE